MPPDGVPTLPVSLLYVDDEPALLEIGKLFLERSGTISVTTTSSAKEALLVLSQNGIDAVVSDYQMPEMDGIEFLQHLRAQGNMVPFIIFTGRGREEVVIEALNNGADFYIQKGGDPGSQFAELAHKVHHAVSRRRSEALISRRYLFEKTVRALSSRFVGSVGFDEAVNASLEDIGRFCGASRAYVFLIRDGSPVFDNTHEWCAEGVSPEIDALQNLPEATFSWWMGKLRCGEIIHVEDAAAMPEEAAAERELLRVQGVQSLIVLPLNVKGELAGFIGFDNVHTPGSWSSEDVDLLRICSEIITSALERRRIEDVLRQSEERYRMLADNTPDFIYSYDAFGRFTAVNRSLCRAIGLVPEEIVGKCHRELGFPDGVIRAWDELHGQVLSCREIVEAETATPMPDGFVHTYEIVLIPVIDEGGHVCGIRGVSRDITGKKRIEEELLQKNEELLAANEQLAAAEEELRQQLEEITFAQKALEGSENRYRGIFECTGAATIILEKDMLISLTNSAFERLSGYGREAIEKRQQWTEHVHPDDLEWMKDYHRMRRIRPESVPNQYEFRYLDRDRMERLVHLTVGNIPGTDQSVASLVDITDRKRAEEALQLANRKLHLLSSITRHDILNQMMVLRGTLELAGALCCGQEQARYLQRAEMAAGAILRQIEFAREYEKLGVSRAEWQNLSTVVAAGVGGRLPVQNELGSLTVYADMMLEQVFANLADNTIRYGERATGVRTYYRMAGEDAIVVWEDDGAGIPDDQKEKIFERGFGRNTGLGLFLIGEILAITGMTIRETGEYGKGARFEITVPKRMWRVTDRHTGNDPSDP